MLASILFFLLNYVMSFNRKKYVYIKINSKKPNIKLTKKNGNQDGKSRVINPKGMSSYKKI